MTSPRCTLTYRRHRYTIAVLLAAALALLSLCSAGAAATPRSAPKPTVVLVHGAWADASSWSRVVGKLQDDGYKTVAAPNPLRSLAGDSAYLGELLDALPGPLVLVGHSYGAAVVTNAANGHPNVRSLVFVNGLVPAEGEAAAPLAGRDSALNAPDPAAVFNFVPVQGMTTPASDLYIKTATFVKDFANGLRRDQAEVLAASQRPVTMGALSEPSGRPAWRDIPSWFLIGTQDHIIPASAQQTMATRARSRVQTYDAGHLGLLSHPKAVVRVIERAASSEH